MIPSVNTAFPQWFLPRHVIKLYMLRISASNVLKTLLDIITSIRIKLGLHLLLTIRINQPEAINTYYLIRRYPAGW